MTIDWTQIVLSGVGAGLGTWFGAWAAFRHERKDREETLHRQQGESLRRTLFVLLSQRTMLTNVRDQQLALYAGVPLTFRHVAVQPFFVAPEELQLDLEPLLFVLSTTDADVLNRLEVTNRSYRTILASINTRNDLHREGQNLLAKSGKTGSVNEAEIKQVVGPNFWAQLKDLTDHLYESLPTTLERIDQNYVAVEAIAKNEFPEVRLFTVERLTP